MLVLQAVALVVLVTELAKELGEGSVDTFSFFLKPRGRPEVRSARARINRLHLFDPDDRLQVVATGFDLSRRSEESDRARSACGFVAARRQSREGRVDLREERTEVTLHAVELGGEVANVRALDFFRCDLANLKCSFNTFAHQRGKVLIFLRPVPCKIRLVTTQDVDFRSSCHVLILQLRSLRAYPARAF